MEKLVGQRVEAVWEDKDGSTDWVPATIVAHWPTTSEHDRKVKTKRKTPPPFMPDPGHASLSVSWVGHLRGCNSHGGAAPRRAFGAGGCPFTGRDRSGDPLHTELWFWRLLLALNAVATPEAVLGECVAMLLRQSIEPLRKRHR